MSDIYDDIERQMIGNPLDQPPAVLAASPPAAARPLISLVMIVKNETVALPACLDSVQGLVDEWVIVDTGSTDGTQDLVRERCGAVHEIPFTNFVDTKNAALALATGQYILFMDADERLLDGHDRLRAAAQAGEVGAVAGRIIEGPLPQIVNTYYRNRLWRNDGSWRFVGPGVHEVVVGDGPVVWEKDVVVYHDHRHRTPESYAARYELYLGLLHAALDQDPHDTRAWFYLARTLRDADRHLEAIEAYESYLTLDSNFRDERWQAAFDIATCWQVHGEYGKAWAALDRAREIDPRRAETECLAGDLHMQLAEWQAAATCYERAAQLPIPTDVVLFLDPQAHVTRPHDQLVICYDKLRDYAAGLRQAVATNLAYPQPQPRVVNNLTFLRVQHDRRWFFWLGRTPEPVTGDLIEKQGVGGVETTYIELPKALAAAGQRVMVACACDAAHVVDGVWFVPYTQPDTWQWFRPQVVVASRDFSAFRGDVTNLVWLQDAWFAEPPAGIWDQAAGVVVSSPWHRSYLAQRAGAAAIAKSAVIPLGIRKAMFAGLETVAKLPRQVIYSSNPDRGLETLRRAWPEICERVPEANLVVTYGWEGLRTWSNDPAWQAQQEQRRTELLAWAEQAGNVRFTGRLRKADLYRELAQSAVCGYSNNFWETFCITALETQAAGTPMVTTALGALPTTLNQDCNILIEGDPFSANYQSAFTDALVDLLLDDARRADYAAQCRAHITQTPCDWTDIARQWLHMLWQL